MAGRLLRRLELFDIDTRNNRDRRDPYIFDSRKYGEEQFRGRCQVTRARFRGLFDIHRSEISGHNNR